MTSPSGVVFYLQYYSPSGKSIYGNTKSDDDGELLVWNQNTGRFALDESYSLNLTRNEYHPIIANSATFATNTITVTPAAGNGTAATTIAGDTKIVALLAASDLTAYVAATGVGNSIVIRCFYQGVLVDTTRLGYVSAGSYTAAQGAVTTTDVGTYVAGTGFTVAPSFTNTAFTFTGTEAESEIEIYIDYDFAVLNNNGSDLGNAYNAEGDAVYGNNDSGNFPIPEMEFRIFQDQIKATKRALKTAWTIEDEQDMKAFHNIDVEKELVTVMSSEIAAEIDREIITDLRNNVGFEMLHNWATGNVPTLPSTPHPGLGMGYQDLAIALCSTLTAASNEVYRRTMRGAANWAIMSPTLSARFEALNQFKYTGSPDETQANLGMAVVGTVNGSIKIIKDPLTMNNKITLGMKGGSFMDVGYVYAPYIPVMQIDTLTDPADLTRRKAVLTRYGKTMLKRGYNYYGSVAVTNTPDVFTHYCSPRGTVMNGAQSGPLRSFASDNALSPTNSLI